MNILKTIITSVLLTGVPIMLGSWIYSCQPVSNENNTTTVTPSFEVDSDTCGEYPTIDSVESESIIGTN